MTIGKSKLAEMAWSDSLAPWPLVPAPRFVNNGYVTAETTYALHRHVMRHAPGQGWRASACMSFPTEALAAAASGLQWSGSKAGSHEALLWLRSRGAVALWRLLLSLPRQPGESKLPAVPRLLGAPPRRSAQGLPALGSANWGSSVNSKTTGRVSRMNSNATTKEISLEQ